jgi:hypothetical protein
MIGGDRMRSLENCEVYRPETGGRLIDLLLPPTS